jgi:hypothetical protein
VAALDGPLPTDLDVHRDEHAGAGLACAQRVEVGAARSVGLEDPRHRQQLRRRERRIHQTQRRAPHQPDTGHAQIHSDEQPDDGIEDLPAGDDHRPDADDHRHRRGNIRKQVLGIRLESDRPFAASYLAQNQRHAQVDAGGDQGDDDPQTRLFDRLRLHHRRRPRNR